MSDTPPKGAKKVRDLTTLEGLNAYVRDDMAGAIAHSLDVAGVCPHIGVVLAQREGGHPLAEPQPAIFGGLGISTEDVEKLLRFKALNLNGTGVLYIDPSGRRVRIALEHREMGDYEWTAELVNKRMGELIGPNPTDDEDQTRFLPKRYMA